MTTKHLWAKDSLQTILDKLFDETIRNVITGFRKRQNAHVNADSVHFEHSI